MRVKDKFLASVKKTKTCWLWTGLTLGGGYGRFRQDEKSKEIYAHRWAWTNFKSVIPEGLQVLHKCDTPGCVKPAHLFLGTQKDNVRDMIAKGRDVRLKGNASPWFGKKHTPETKAKMSVATSGEKHPMFGKTLSKETKNRMSKAHKRRWKTYVMTDEEIRKRSESHKGKQPTLGFHWSSASKRKMSRSMKKVWARRKALK